MSCGGCIGLGSHRRWCPSAVGASAARWGEMAEQIESLADGVGGNEPAAANALYLASSLLRQKAVSLASEGWK